MSTRAIVDFDDTDPDMDDDEDGSTHPDYDATLQNDTQPTDFTQQHQAVDIDTTARFDTVIPRSHRLLTFDEDTKPNAYQDFQPVQQWPTSMGTDAPTVHRLRDALFTQSRRESTKFEPAYDVDMLDRAAVKVDDQLIDAAGGHVQTDDDIKSRDVNVSDEFLIAAREAEEEADLLDKAKLQQIEQIDENQPQLQSYTSTVTAFPPLAESCAAERQHLYLDSGLLLGRSTRLCFTMSSHYISSVHHPRLGFITNINSNLVDSTPLDHRSLSKLLNLHCGTWFECLKSPNMSNEGNNNAIDAGFSGFELRRGVRMPTFTKAFSSGDLSDHVMKWTSETLLELDSFSSDINAQHASITFSLLLALYKSTDSKIDRDGQPELLSRLAEWARGPAGHVFDNDEIAEARGLRKAVLALSVGMVDQAVEIAIEHGHMRLAMLMSRALEIPKGELRRDADAQLDSYGLIMDTPTAAQKHTDMQNGDSYIHLEKNATEEHVRTKSPWDRMLVYCEEEANVCINERMILLILAGRVAPVARFLKFSWYRLFIMELLYGAGSSGEENSILQWQRVAAAVRAVGDSRISTIAPHRETEDSDVIYQLLRLYAEESEKHKHSITTHLYNNSAFGFENHTLDYRFTWLLHQVLSALIPEASPKMASAKLADGLSAQLRGNGLHLWSYYVLCSGNVDQIVLKETLIRDWPVLCDDVVEVNFSTGLGEPNTNQNMNNNNDDAMLRDDNDQNECNELRPRPSSEVQMGAEEFLLTILGVPEAWIHEAKAVTARVAGRRMLECEEWLRCGEHGVVRCHEVATRHVVPEAIVANDKQCLAKVCDMLSTIEAGMTQTSSVPDWTCAGGLILEYLKHIAGITELVDADIHVLHRLAANVRVFVDRATARKADTAKCAGSIMADGIITAQRALLMRVPDSVADKWIASILSDLENVPCSKAVRLRLTAEYKLILTHGWPGPQRIAGAFPAYRKYVEALGVHSVESELMEDQTENADAKGRGGSEVVHLSEEEMTRQQNVSSSGGALQDEIMVQ